MIYLSNFNTMGRDERAVSIAAITPHGFKGQVRKDLAPPVPLFRACQKGEITVSQFIEEYVYKLYLTVDFDEVVSSLDGKILCCYCKKTQFCHRALLGLYLTAETGVDVQEVGGYADWFLETLDNVKKYGLPCDLELGDDEIRENGLEDLGTTNATGIWRELKKRNLLHLYKITA